MSVKSVSSANDCLEDDGDFNASPNLINVVVFAETKEAINRAQAIEYAEPAVLIFLESMVDVTAEKAKTASLIIVECRAKNVMDDLGLIRRLRAERPMTPIVAITAIQDQAFVAQAFDTGVTDVVGPEVPPDVIAAKVRTLHRLSESGRLIEIQNGELVANMQGLREANKALKHEMAERIKAERQKAEVQDMMHETAKMASLGEMAAGIAHEIRSPLSIVTGSLSMLPDMIKAVPLDQEATLGVLKDLEKMTDRIEAIIRGLKAYSREGATDPHEHLPINHLISDTVAFCTEAFEHASIKLTIDEVPDALAIDCQPTQMSQVLLNLLTNARHAIEKSDGSRWIRVGIKDFGESVELSVTDSGKGIPVDIRERIMEAFFTTKPKGIGTGLGLSISKKIVASHGGELKLDTTCANTRFVWTLNKRQGGSVRAPNAGSK